MPIVGVDIGTTTISFVLLKNNRVLSKRKIQTPKSKKEFFKALKENIRSLSKSFKLTGIGIGVPGPLNQKGDLVLNPPNLTYLKYCSLAKIIKKEFKVKTKMENDGNCFALAEAILGAGKSAKKVYGITLGSGIGNGIVIDGKIYRGAFGSAGEAGHMTIKFDGLKCSCGNLGCWEEYASKKFIERKTRLEPKDLFELAKQGDKKAQRIFQEFGKNLGIGLANVINILDPEVVVIGGGLAKAKVFFFKSINQEIRRRVLSPLSRKYVKVKKAELGEYAGAIGASLLIDYY